MWIQRTSHSTLKINTLRTNNPQLRIDLRYICTLSLSRWYAIKYVGGLYTSETTGNKTTPADTTRSSSNKKKNPHVPATSANRCKPTHAPTESGTTNRVPANHILLFNCNKWCSCLCLFPYPPPNTTDIQEITWLQNVGIGSVPTGFIRIYRLYVEIKCHLHATEVFIADLFACSTCFGHQYAHHQELKSIIQWLLPVAFCAVVFASSWSGVELRVMCPVCRMLV